MAHNAEELIDELSLDRDYGARTYEEVVTGIREGSINVSPGHPVPMLRVDGLSIKGSGAPLALVESSTSTNHQKPWVSQFEERASTDFDTVYESLLASAVKGEVKAQMYFLDRLLGKPRESRDTGNTELLSAFVGALAGTRMAEVQQPSPPTITVIDSLD